MQGDWSRFAYPVQRSYGISVDEWSDQPLVPASFWFFRNTFIVLAKYNHEIYFRSNCLGWDPVPDGSLQRSNFVYSVISMVTPTWCHGATWGNSFAGDCGRTWHRNWHFKLVICLSKAKQLAFRLCTFLRSPAGPVVPWDPSEPAPSPKWDCSELQKLFLFHLRSFWSDIWTAKAGTCFPGVVFLSFDGFLWGWAYRAPNSLELEQLFMPLRHDLTTVPKGNNARPLV